MYASLQPTISRRLVCLVAAPLLVLVLAGSAAGDIVLSIDPFADPEVTLPPEEAARLGTLLSASFPPLISDVSPDDRTVLTATPTEGVAFLDLHTRATVPVAPEFYGFQPVSEFRWRSRSTLAFAAFDGSGNPVLGVRVPRRWRGHGRADRPHRLPRESFHQGRPVGCGPGGGGGGGGPRPWTPRRGLAASPFVERSLSAFKRPGPAIFDAERKLQSVRVATILVELAVLDLASGEDRPLLRMAPETALPDVEAGPRATTTASLSCACSFPTSPVAGSSRPRATRSRTAWAGSTSENPFFLSNAFDLFRLDGHRIKRVELRPTLAHGSVFLYSVWSPDGDTLMVQMWDPGTPKGHPHPVYGEANRSHFHFDPARGRLIRELDLREIDSVSDLLFFPTDRDVVILVPFELSYGLFHYDLRHNSLRRLPTEKGSIYQARATTHSRELIYNFGSLESPYEMYKIRLGSHGPRKLTNLNESVAAANRIRADKVRFHLEDGDTREGFLLQPRGAAFPPRDVRLVVWQQGGPTAPMTEDWGGLRRAAVSTCCLTSASPFSWCPCPAASASVRVSWTSSPTAATSARSTSTSNPHRPAARGPGLDLAAAPRHHRRLSPGGYFTARHRPPPEL